MSPMISSSENSTAAIGVLNAAASAADAPTGTSQRTCAVLSPSRRAITDAMPEPMCTDGPSRPSAMPLASDVEQQTNLPTTVRSEMRPSWMKIAARVCGMPLPRASGKNRNSRTPVTSAPSVGTTIRRHAAPARRIHVRGQPAGEQDERDDDEPDERADDEAQQQREPILAPAEILDQFDEAAVPRRGLVGSICRL